MPRIGFADSGYYRYYLSPATYVRCFMFGAIAGGIASALAGGAMSILFGGGQKADSGGIQGDVLATDNNTVGMGDAGIKSAIQGSNVPNPDEAVPSFVSGA